MAVIRNPSHIKLDVAYGFAPFTLVPGWDGEINSEGFMRLLRHVACALLLATSAAQAEVKEKWSLSGFSHPESVDLDVPHQVFYVTNINGAPPSTRTATGFISKVSRDGKLILLKWIDGLHAPKGMVMQGFKLWVTDIDRLVEIDTRIARSPMSIRPRVRCFLNDPAVDKRGYVYVTDIAKATIWRLKDGKMKIWYDKPDLMHSNGLRVVPWRQAAGGGLGPGNAG